MDLWHKILKIQSPQHTPVQLRKIGYLRTNRSSFQWKKGQILGIPTNKKGIREAVLVQRKAVVRLQIAWISYLSLTLFFFPKKLSPSVSLCISKTLQLFRDRDLQRAKARRLKPKKQKGKSKSRQRKLDRQKKRSKVKNSDWQFRMPWLHEVEGAYWWLPILWENDWGSL